MCARVDYFVDGQPFVSVVVDGEDREDWLARTTNPRILVQSCQVCRDSGPNPTPAAPARDRRPPAAGAPAAAAGDGALEPLISGVPEYPEAARARGLRGSVEVEFTVTPAGHGREPARRLSRASERVRLGGSGRRRAPPLSRGRGARAADFDRANRVRAAASGASLGSYAPRVR